MVATTEEFVNEHRYMVKQIAGKAAGLAEAVGVEPREAEAYGLLGLMEAWRTYEPGRGTHVSTYAWGRIRGAVMDGIRRASAWHRTRPATPALVPYPGRAASPRSLEPCSPSAARIYAALAESNDASDTSGDGLRVAECEFGRPRRSPESEAEMRRALVALCRALDGLRPDESKIIYEHYVLNVPLCDLGRATGASRSTVVRRHDRALKRLRIALAAKGVHGRLK